MSQIVRRKKKGRPSKADLERRNSTSSEPPSGDKEPRRSLRRRNVRYNFDFDDYIDDDDYQDDDEGFRKREKKLRLLLKLQGSSGTGKGDDSELTRRVDYDAPSPSAYSSESDEDDKRSKKRKVGGDDEIDGDDDEENEIEEEIEEAEERKAEASEPDSVPGTPAADVNSPATELHMPDKKTIELILDKLQKKDIYGVYAEPVDPEELPDYHDVIKNPMDFATVRRKLGNGSYSRLEQLESDVFLICSNAMQYNAPDTVYHKQASSIQELARRKFQRLRDNVDRSEVELKSEDKTTSSSIFPRRQAKKPLDRSVQEPVGSDFSSGTALATTGEVQNGSMAARDASCERPRGVDGLKAENSLFTDNNIDKGEESLPGKSFLSRLGRKPSIQDENRRATYNLSDQPPTASESIFSTFEGEAKQLVPVGLQADHSYARSLARFAATLGSIAWKVASERIEQALPDGTKFGCGWVGEYEPLPTPVLILENCTIKEPIFPSSSKVRANQKTSRDPVSVIVPESVPTLEGKPLLFGTSTSRAGTWLPAKEESPRGTSLDARSPFFCPPGAKPSEFVNSNYRQQHSPSMNSGEPERNGSSKPLRNSVEPERKSSSAASPRGTLDQRAPFFCLPGAKPSELFSPNSRQQLSPFEPGRRGSLTPLGNSVEPERKSSSILSRNSVEPERSSLTPSRNSAEPERKSSSTLSRNSVEPERKSSLTPSRNSAEPERKSSTQVELNHASPANKNTADFMRERQIPHNGSELPASWSAESVQRSRNLVPSASFKQPNSKTAQIGELHNKKPMGLYSNGMVPSSTNNYPNQMTGAGKYFPQQQQQQQQQEQGLSDPVQLMKMMAEKNQNQHKPPNISVVETQQAVSLPHAPSPKREESNNNAAVTAARAWMSLGASGFKPASENNGSHKMQIPADSLYNGTHKMQIPSDSIYNGTHNHQPQASRFRGELPPAGMQFQPDKNSFPVHAFVQQPVRMVNEAHSGQFQNRPMGFPQLVTADLSRFQMQSPWRGVSLQQMQQRQKQESLPPDLNIGFQSVGSPGRQQSSGVLVDSQQPDLALQL